jgi:phage tail sheath gpL-like
MPINITFDYIPDQLRLPGTLIELHTLGGAGAQQFKGVVYGQRLATGTVPAGEARRVTSAEQAELYWGRGSMIAEMFRVMKKVNLFFEVWGIGLDDDAAAVAATGSMAFAGPATGSGTLMVYAGGRVVKVGVIAADTAAEIATALAAAVAADTRLPITAAVDGVDTAKVNFTARHKGEEGNNIDIRVSYFDEPVPSGVGITIVPMAGGTTNPDIADAIAGMGSEWFNYVCMPYTDAANMTALETEAGLRFQPPAQQGFRTFVARRGNHTDTSTFGGSRNSAHVTCLGTNLSPAPTWIWAALNAIVAAPALVNHPARQMRGLNLPNVEGYYLAPALSDRWDPAERNLHLYDGISTYTVGTDGSVYLEWQITMYQTNAQGLADESRLLINTPELEERIRYRKIVAFANYPRHLLAEDEAKPGVGQPVMQPKTATGILLREYAAMESDAWVQDYDGYKAELLVGIDPDNGTRLNVQDRPRHVNPLGIIAIRTESYT